MSEAAAITYATIDSLLAYLTLAQASAIFAPIASPSFTSGATVLTGELTVSAGNLTITNPLNLIKASLVGPATNGVSFALCGTQTTGVLNIGTGARTTTGTINIGTGSGTIVNPIVIGSTNTTTTINGTVSLSKALTLPTTSITPTSTQLGYTFTSAISGPSGTISSTTGLLSVTNTPIGIYILIYNINVDTSTSNQFASAIFTFPVTGGCSVSFMERKLGCSVQAQATGTDLIGYLICTTATNSVTMSMSITAGTAIARTYKYTLIKVG
jgi:hypothetical protein